MTEQSSSQSGMSCVGVAFMILILGSCLFAGTGDISGIENDVTTLEQDVEELERQVGTLENRISELEGNHEPSE